MSAENIMSQWRSKKFKPLYWLEGEEEYFIDELIDYAEHKILNEAEKGFNQTIFYGKDAVWTDVVNACSRYPMFADKQIVMLKEAQHMKDIEKLENYIASPLSSTIFIVSYKGKTMDARTKVAKLLQKHGEVFQAKKIYDSALPSWTADIAKRKGLEITPRALTLLADHIGNDLARMANEIEKISMNLAGRKSITEDDIEKYVGVSKDYNVFELQKALAKKDLAKAVRIIQYFEHNPKAAPIQMLLPALYSYFSKMLILFQMPDKSESAIKSMFYHSDSIKQAKDTLLNSC